MITTDAGGNLASDGGEVFRKIARIDAGVALSIAMQTPALSGQQNFGLRVGYGNFDRDANAFGVSAIGVVCRGCWGQTDQIAIDAAAAVGSSSFMTYGSGTVGAARLGVQWTWR